MLLYSRVISSLLELTRTTIVVDAASRRYRDLACDRVPRRPRLNFKLLKMAVPSLDAAAQIAQLQQTIQLLLQRLPSTTQAELLGSASAARTAAPGGTGFNPAAPDAASLGALQRVLAPSPPLPPPELLEEDKKAEALKRFAAAARETLEKLVQELVGRAPSAEELTPMTPSAPSQPRVYGLSRNGNNTCFAIATLQALAATPATHHAATVCLLRWREASAEERQRLSPLAAVSAALLATTDSLPHTRNAAAQLLKDAVAALMPTPESDRDRMHDAAEFATAVLQQLLACDPTLRLPLWRRVLQCSRCGYSEEPRDGSSEPAFELPVFSPTQAVQLTSGLQSWRAIAGHYCPTCRREGSVRECRRLCLPPVADEADPAAGAAESCTAEAAQAPASGATTAASSSGIASRVPTLFFVHIARNLRGRMANMTAVRFPLIATLAELSGDDSAGHAVYRLASVVEHKPGGSVNRGHYVAYSARASQALVPVVSSEPDAVPHHTVPAGAFVLFDDNRDVSIKLWGHAAADDAVVRNTKPSLLVYELVNDGALGDPLIDAGAATAQASLLSRRELLRLPKSQPHAPAFFAGPTERRSSTVDELAVKAASVAVGIGEPRILAEEIQFRRKPFRKTVEFLRMRLLETEYGSIFRKNPAFLPRDPHPAEETTGGRLDGSLVYGLCQLGKTKVTLGLAWLAHFVYNVVPFIFVRNHGCSEAWLGFEQAMEDFNENFVRKQLRAAYPDSDKADWALYELHPVSARHKLDEALFQEGKAQVVLRSCGAYRLEKMVHERHADLLQVVRVYRAHKVEWKPEEKYPIMALFDEADTLVQSFGRNTYKAEQFAFQQPILSPIDALSNMHGAAAGTPVTAEVDPDDDADSQASEEQQEDEASEARSVDDEASNLRGITHAVYHSVFITATPGALLITGLGVEGNDCSGTPEGGFIGNYNFALMAIPGRESRRPYYGLSHLVEDADLRIQPRHTEDMLPGERPALDKHPGIREMLDDMTERQIVISPSSSTTTGTAAASRVSASTRADAQPTRVGLVHCATSRIVHESMATQIIREYEKVPLIVVVHNGEGIQVHLSARLPEDDVLLFRPATGPADDASLFNWSFVKERLLSAADRKRAREDERAFSPDASLQNKVTCNVLQRRIRFSPKIKLVDVLTMVRTGQGPVMCSFGSQCRACVRSAAASRLRVGTWHALSANAHRTLRNATDSAASFSCPIHGLAGAQLLAPSR